MDPTSGKQRSLSSEALGPQGSAAPFREAGSAKAVRPERAEEPRMSSRERDTWSGNADVLTRLHVRERKAMFTPVKVDEETRPCRVKDIGDIRITEGIGESGEAFRIHDYWRASKRPHRDLKEA